MTINRSKSTLKIVIQYGGRLFSETGSSNFSAVNRDVSSVFGQQIDFEILKRVTSLNTQSMTAILKYRYDVITLPAVTRFGRNLSSIGQSAAALCSLKFDLMTLNMYHVLRYALITQSLNSVKLSVHEM